eukprot:638667-Lingulodinium_polyedra.AAC.1
MLSRACPHPCTQSPRAHFFICPAGEAAMAPYAQTSHPFCAKSFWAAQQAEDVAPEPSKPVLRKRDYSR